jgi:hypothetical protein
MEKEMKHKFVLDGGPWRHKGDGLFIVPYDGKNTAALDLNSDVVRVLRGLIMRRREHPASLADAATRAETIARTGGSTCTSCTASI